MLSLEDISPKELVERLHSKVQNKHVVFLPSVNQKITGPGNGEDASNAKGEGHGVVHPPDLLSVLKFGSLVALEACRGGWEMTLLGTGLEPLLVSVYLSRKENDPLQIRDFGSVQERFINLVATLSNEEQATTHEFINYLEQKSPASSSAFRAALDSFVREHRELLQNLAH